MKRKNWILLPLLLLATPLFAQQQPIGAKPAPPQTPVDKASYSFGVMVGRGIQRDMKSQGLTVNFAMVLRGIADAISGKPALSDDQLRLALEDLEQQAKRSQEQRNARMAQQGSKNKATGEAFLAANAKKPGVTVLPSGLQYRVLKSGTGPRPTATSTVSTHYHGTLIDGTVFDSSVKRGKPVEFPVNGVIRGWTEALQLMRVGDKWQLFIPSNLAYGSRGAGDAIGPDSALIFEVELLAIVK